MSLFHELMEKLNEAYAGDDPRWDEDRGVFTLGSMRSHLLEVVPKIYTAGLVMTPKHNLNEISDTWCYHTIESAIAAGDIWLEQIQRSRDDVAERIAANGPLLGVYVAPNEPAGWHRHPATGRRRPDGDPSKEYINP